MNKYVGFILKVVLCFVLLYVIGFICVKLGIIESFENWFTTGLGVIAGLGAGKLVVDAGKRRKGRK